MAIYALWYGGHGNYADADTERDLERFDDMDEAHAALLDRYQEGSYSHDFSFVNRPSERVMTPCVGDDTRMDVYLSLDIDEGTGDVLVHSNGPDVRLSIHNGRTVADPG